jgi:glycosyltransferase involved in cell wall biosynthesis
VSGRAKRVLVHPADANPYLESLYSELRAFDVEHRYAGELTPSHTLNLCLLPFEVVIRRVAGYRLFHLHWVFRFTAPLLPRARISRTLMRWYFVVLLELLRRIGVRIVWTAHNVLPHDQVFDDDPRARRQLVERCAAVIAHDDATLAELSAIGCRLPLTKVIAPGGPKVVKAVHPLADRSERSPLRLVFVGRVAPYKGLEDLMEALSTCPAALSIVIAGECRDRQLAKSLVRKAAATPAAVELRLDRLRDEEVASLLYSADAAVFPFRSVTTSGSVLLALSAGCPVVIPDLPAFSRVPSTCAWRYTGGIKALADVLTKVASTPATLRTEMSTAALTYSDLASWATSALATSELYEQITEGNSLGSNVTLARRDEAYHRDRSNLSAERD